MKGPQERRKHPRIDSRLSAGVQAGGDSLAVTTLNVGAGGVYVEVPRFIEPLTKLRVTLDIPGPGGGAHIETDAIVVRTTPERAGADAYEIACAFLALSDPDRDAIQRYVATHRAGTSPKAGSRGR
jgi:hypothetical protein